MKRPLRPCKSPGCNSLVKKGYCKKHEIARQKKFRNMSLKEKNLFSNNRLSARQRGYDTSWDKFRRYYLRKYPVCAICKSLSSIPHHITPLPEGSKYDEMNLLPVCLTCHNKIHHARLDIKAIVKSFQKNHYYTIDSDLNHDDPLLILPDTYHL